MDVDQAKAEIARRVFHAGYVVEPDEIIDGPLDGGTLVCARSLRALRTVEQPDGTFTTELYNMPIIWIEYPPLDFVKTQVADQSFRYTIPVPTPRVLHPEFCIFIPAAASPGASVRSSR